MPQLAPLMWVFLSFFVFVFVFMFVSCSWWVQKFPLVLKMKGLQKGSFSSYWRW